MDTLEALAREQRTLAVWLCREYGALSFEDAEDLVAEALSRLNGDLPSQLPAARAYLRTMLRRDAIDELRHRHGRRPNEKAQRPKVVALGELPDGAEPAGPQTVDGELVRRATRSLSAAAVQRALAKLPEQERETLRMRYLDDLEPTAICRGLGLSRTQYERRLTDGIRGALEALVADTPLDACHAVRAAIATGRLGADDAARRDAHLEECLSCRAFERRARGLLALLPTAPALGWWAQLRLKGEGWLHRGAEAAGGAPGDAATATAAGGATAGAAGGLSASGLLGGAALKAAAVCSGAAVAAVCVVQIPAPRDQPADRSRAAASAAREPAARATAAPTAAIPVATTRPAAARESSPRPAAGQRKRTTAAQRAGAKEAARAAEFSPDGGGTPSRAMPTTATATAAAASSGAESGAGDTGAAPRSTPAPPDDSVSAEFSP